MNKTFFRKAMVLALLTLSLYFFCAAASSEISRVTVQNRRAQTPVSAPTPPSGVLANSADTFFYDTDTLWLTAERTAYTDNALTLLVPRLSLVVGVQNGTDDDALARGVGLYDASQLPNDASTNENVAIAGHRGAQGCEFYNLDKLTDGDFIFLEYKGMRYAYQWVESIVVAADDWRPIFCREEESVTLTSCHPLGSNRQRLCAIGRLVGSERIEE
ncbi:MAG: class E sortase [Ruthenibacterium sp.]